MTAVVQNPPVTAAVPATDPIVTPPEKRENDSSERALIDASTSGPVLAFIGTGILWLLVSTLLGLITSIKVHSPGFLADIPFLTYGRILPAYNNALIYGWCSLTGIGVGLWIMARLCRVSVRSPGLLVLGAFLWNFGLLLGIGAILFGKIRPMDLMEMPAAAHWLMFAGFAFVGLGGAALYRFRRQDLVYISVWYLLGAFFWFPWTLGTANVVLASESVRGVMQNVVGAWFAQSILGWWLTSLGLAAAYFLIPKVINQPVRSYPLASIGFWSFAVLSGLTGMTRITGGPIPVWLQTLSIAASIMLLVPIACVTANLLLTMRGNYNMVFHSPTTRFTFFGAIAFVGAAVMGVAITLRSTSRLFHFTEFVTAQNHALILLFFSMVMFGAIYYITPRLVGCEWLSSSMISVHFWGAAYGGGLLVSLLLFAGLAQGFSLVDPDATFTQIAQIPQIYYVGRTLATFMVLFGNLVFAFHFLLMLLRIGQPGGEPTLFAPLGEEAH